jgi:hypothetical protein
MSYIPGTEFHHGYDAAPKAAHGRNYKRYHRARATMEKDFRLSNMINQNVQQARNMHANIALRDNFLRQQASSNVLNELSRIGGILDQHRQYRLSDGTAFNPRMKKLESDLASLKPQPLAGPEGRYLY